MREHTISYVTERTHKLDTVLRSIYAVRHPLCTKEAYYKDEIPNVHNGMTKYLKLRSYFVVLFAQNVYGAMILIFEIAKAKKHDLCYRKKYTAQR